MHRLLLMVSFTVSHLLFAAALLVWTPAVFAENAKFKKHEGAGVKDRYIVLIDIGTPADEVNEVAKDLSHTYKLKLESTWEKVKGFLVTAKEADAIAAASDERVELVEQDLKMRSDISSMMLTNFYPPVPPNEPGPHDLWYLDRLDEVYWDNRFTDATEDIRDFSYNRCPAGNTTTAYIIDQPVWASHSSVSGRVTTMVDCHTGTCSVTDAATNCLNSSRAIFTTHSHGTAVASLLSGASTGAALPEIISVNVWPCSTTIGTGPTQAGVMAAINWIWTHVDGRKAAGTFKPSVVNHSGYLYPWDANAPAYSTRARDFVKTTNVPYFTSADNWGTDSCLFSPNNYAYTWNAFDSTRAIFAVGATMRPDAGTDPNRTDGVDYATWNPNFGAAADNRGTNLGACVSAFAPGEAVYGAANGNHLGNPPVENADYYRYWTGTSMASPLAAGVALRKLHEWGYQPTYNTVYNWLLGTLFTDKAAVVTTVNPDRQAMTICYTAGAPHSWNYPGVTTCGAGETAYVLPGGATNTSGARMISWVRGCNTWE